MRKLLVFLSVVVLLLTPCQDVRGEPGPGSVLVHCHMEQTVEGLEISLYKVGDMDGTSMELTDKYVGINIPDLSSASELQSCAQQIYARIQGSGHKPDFTGLLDANGNIRFENVPHGVYCAASNRRQSGNTIYSVIPVLLFVDGDVSLECKMEARALVIDEKASVSVEKKWVLSHGSSSVPVTVELLRDGVAVDSVELDEKNSWRYTWSDLDKNSVWTVVERKVPEGFVAELSESGSRFIITNTSIDYLKANPQTGLGGALPVWFLCIVFTASVCFILTASVAVTVIISTKSKGEDKK